MEASKKALAILEEEFESKGLVADEVLIRYFEYSEAIQENIEEKKLKDQLVFKNIAEAEAAREYAKLRKVKEEGEAQVRLTIEEGYAYVERRRAEQELYVRKKEAEANLPRSGSRSRTRAIKK